MPFDAKWFGELRSLSENQLLATRELGIHGYVPHVGELCQAGYLSGGFLAETQQFNRLMSRTRYRFDTFFRAYERHVVNFPKGRAFRKQWNIAFTAGDTPDQDYARIGIGFRLLAHEEATGIEEYLEFREHVRRQKEEFDQTFRALGNYYEFDDISESAAGALSRIIIADQPPLDAWRFFGRRLWFHDPQDHALIVSHERLRDAVIEVCDAIQHSGFGM